MNEVKITPFAIAFFFVAIVLFWLFFRSITGDSEITVVTNFEECVAEGNAVMESYPRQCRTGEETFVENIGNELEKFDVIHINSPRPNETVTSPLVIEGEARGYWFFEGSFPIELQSESGVVIATSFVTAEGEWMTEEFVPFRGELIFKDTGEKGTLILRKDNPSDLQENDDELVVPITMMNRDF